MKTLSLLSVFAALFLSLAVSRAQALTAEELTPQEQQRYATLNNDATAQQSYLITRDYVRKAKAVVGGQLAAISMPDEPDEFNAKFLFPGESKTLKSAIQKALSAYIDSRSRTA